MHSPLNQKNKLSNASYFSTIDSAMKGSLAERTSNTTGPYDVNGL
jgi:hypothetical protein